MNLRKIALSIYFLAFLGCGVPSEDSPSTKPPMDKKWLFHSEQDILFFNPNLLNNVPCATLLEWTGPNTSNPPLGLTGVLTAKGYAWRTWNPGLRTFYVAYTADSCENAMSHAITVNGQYSGYQIGSPEVTTMDPSARKWIWCDWGGCQTGTWPCGCDGKAYFSGTDWVPQGNQ